MIYLLPYLPAAKELFGIAPQFLLPEITFHTIDEDMGDLTLKEKRIIKGWIASRRLIVAGVGDHEITQVPKYKAKYGELIDFRTYLAIALCKFRNGVMVTRDPMLIELCNNENVHHMDVEIVKYIIEFQEM